MAARTDMDRIGLFKEMSYHTVGDKYVAPSQVQFNVSAAKGRQMLPGGIKARSATSAGYFTDFSRVFEKEAYNNPIDIRRKQRKIESRKNLGKAWVPSHVPEDPSGTGSCYGTFSGPVPFFSGMIKGQKAYTSPKPNILTNPPKWGTGYGYVDVTLSKYPTYQADKYGKGEEIMRRENEKHKSKTLGRSAFKLNSHPQAFFDVNPYHTEKMMRSAARKSAPPRLVTDKPFKPTSPSKMDGGMKAGCFDSFPTYPSNPYLDKPYKRPERVVNSSGKVFVPSQGPKSAPVSSIVHRNVIRSVNSQNYKTISSVIPF